MISRVLACEIWKLFELESACYGENLHGMNNVTIINFELNIQFVTIHTE